VEKDHLEKHHIKNEGDGITSTQVKEKIVKYAKCSGKMVRGKTCDQEAVSMTRAIHYHVVVNRQQCSATD